MDIRSSKSKNDLPPQRRRRKSLFSNVRLLELDQPHHSENFTLLKRPLDESERSRIRLRLQDHFIFGALNDEQLDSIFEQLQYCMTLKDSFVFQQGEDGKHFFFIHRGRVRIVVDGVTVKTMEDFDYFGDFALIYNAPRSASAFCETDTMMWTIERSVFRGLLNSLKAKEYREHAEFLGQLPLFQPLSASQRNQLGKEMILERYRPGQVIVKQGEDALAFFLIRSGQVEVRRGTQLLAVVGEGAYFGENAFATKVSKRSATVLAQKHVQCYSISRSSLIQVLGCAIETVLSKNQLRDVLAKNTWLKHLTNEQLEYLISNLKTSLMPEQTLFFEKDVAYSKLVIVLEGFFLHSRLKDARVVGAEELYNGDVGSYQFAEDILISGKSKVCEISFESFITLFGDAATLVERNGRMAEFLGRTAADRSFEPSFDHIRIIRPLGVGGYGTVYLIEQGGRKLAMKAVHRGTVNTLVEIRLISSEKEIMKALSFPFIVKLECAFKQNNFIFFFTEFVEGTGFDEALQELDLLDRHQAQFYAAQLVLTLQYLHGQAVIYRDLKPQNIILQRNGYLKLLDFGASKCLDAKSEGQADQTRTFTVAGTPHYMAPEIISGGGYGFSVDYWSLGVLLFELIAGYVPFGNDSEDIYEIYGQIIKNPVEFPDWFEDVQAVDLVFKLLNKNCEARNAFSRSALKVHPWFEGVDWLGILEQTVPPVYVPKESEADKEATEGSDVLLRELDGALEHRFAKEGFKTFNKLSIEMDLLWDSFN